MSQTGVDKKQVGTIGVAGDFSLGTIDCIVFILTCCHVVMLSCYRIDTPQIIKLYIDGDAECYLKWYLISNALQFSFYFHLRKKLRINHDNGQKWLQENIDIQSHF